MSESRKTVDPLKSLTPELIILEKSTKLSTLLIRVQAHTACSVRLCAGITKSQDVISLKSFSQNPKPNYLSLCIREVLQHLSSAQILDLGSELLLLSRMWWCTCYRSLIIYHTAPYFNWFQRPVAVPRKKSRCTTHRTKANPHWKGWEGE